MTGDRWTPDDADDFIEGAMNSFPGSRELPPAEPPRRCTCMSPFVIESEYGEPFCVKCGRRERL